MAWKSVIFAGPVFAVAHALGRRSKGNEDEDERKRKIGGSKRKIGTVHGKLYARKDL